ncbi:Bacterial Ig-like domain (group 4) [compost metagenome]
MKKRIFRACIAWIVFSMLVLPLCSAGVSAAAALTASLKVDHNTAAIKVISTANEQDTVTVMIMQKQTRSIAYMDQAELKNGQHTFQTVLPKGEYYGSVSSAGSGKAELQAFTVEHTEAITGFRPLQTLTVAQGGKLVLPGSVIAVFDSGANREVGVKWSGVPDTGTAGQFTVTGNVNESPKTVELVVKVGGGRQRHRLQRQYPHQHRPRLPKRQHHPYQGDRPEQQQRHRSHRLRQVALPSR